MAEDKPLAINSKKKEEKMGNETKESEKENEAKDYLSNDTAA
jgi:hypothetical protein